ncbi:uncharacterized protein LOC116528652 [Sapajus apella]|uniref:Uncharacterized protein LOC116528652 n=1 Tax=Sapajus apella TaxID=9515 RepID=A0A6J3F8R2_SAPAP|nr:uncharacterized protein LOC116528652 [Sapajus apella]
MVAQESGRTQRDSVLWKLWRHRFAYNRTSPQALGSGSQRYKGRVWNGKLIFRPSDWPARTPLTRRATLIGPGGTPLGPQLLCVPGRRAQLAVWAALRQPFGPLLCIAGAGNVPSPSGGPVAAAGRERPGIELRPSWGGLSLRANVETQLSQNKAVDAAATLYTGAARQRAGRSPGTCQGRRRWQRPAHARPLPEARNAEGRAPPFARARRRWPRLPRLRSLSELLRRVRALSPADPRCRLPPLQAPSPPCPLSRPQTTRPFFSPRNGASAARGRAPWTRLALGLALSATARLAPPRALPQSVAPKAPLSGGGGSCFRFFLSVQLGVASSTQPPFPLRQRGAATAEGCGFGGWDRGPRRPPLLPLRIHLLVKLSEACEPEQFYLQQELRKTGLKPTGLHSQTVKAL